MIGTDIALMNLNGIALKVKFKGLQEKAREQIDTIAAARGLTIAELGDRLVPDLDLDADGSRVLDFGSRQFKVAFDQALRPTVRDSQGNLLEDLPKPTKSDDAARARAASETFKLLKKEAKAIASIQIFRLEQAMCAQRRWDLPTWTTFLLDIPCSSTWSRCWCGAPLTAPTSSPPRSGSTRAAPLTTWTASLSSCPEVSWWAFGSAQPRLGQG